LQIPHFQAAFSAPGCCMLRRIAFPVVSEWYQQRHSSFTILLTRARIRSTPSTSLTTPPYSLPSTATRTGCPLWAATPQTEWIRHWAKCSLLAGPATSRAVPRRGGYVRVPGAALGLPVHRAAYRTGYDAGLKGSRWCLREGDRERHGPGGRRD
jgi:hypothetical protein